KFEYETGVQLWMPSGLLEIDQIELNYISARKGDKLYLAFMNQSDQPVSARVLVNDALVRCDRPGQCSFTVEVGPSGIETVVLENVEINPAIQDKIIATTDGAVGNDYLEIQPGNAKAMLMRLSDVANTVYLYLS